MVHCLLPRACIAETMGANPLFAQVMIVDFDVHHGNGTQDLFYGDPSVLFIDMHEQDVWPGSGQAEERGEGAGEGHTINVPLPGTSTCTAAGRLPWLGQPAVRMPVS